MNNYDMICDLSAQCGFKDFTDLQDKCFHDESFYDLDKWLFVIGATGSGKTLVALLSYFYEQRRKAQQGHPYKMLFSVPYRALASQKIDEIFHTCKVLGLNLKILQSTSEHTRDDDDILSGNVDIAVIINEKVFMFASSDDAFLSRYNLLVLDEIALTQDQLRGVKTDFILLKARKEKNLRVLTMGTPFFDWSNYVEKFNFTVLREVHRPIEIKELPLFKSEIKINSLPQKDFFLDICKKHLFNGKRIIIFLNSRKEVQKLSRELVQKLSSCGALKSWIAEEKCKKFILNEIQAVDETTLYATMDTEDYRAFSYGITFHNANMPPSLRYFIERDFMNKKSRLKIICSTETLAYGINSNADVVIIPGMLKNEYYLEENGKMKRKSRFLNPNEYMNYAGRAGRLNPELPLSEQKATGCVYPIMNKSAKKLWDTLAVKIKTPELSVSGYFKLDSDLQAFFVLSFFSEKNTMTAAEIASLLRQLPQADEIIFNEVEFVEKPLQDLLTRRLIYIANEDEDGEDDFILEYKATDVGKKISGFVIRLSDFDKILSDIPTCVTADKIFEADIFYSIISTAGIFLAAKNILGELTGKGTDSDSLFLPHTISVMKEIFKKNRKKMTSELYAQIMKDIRFYEGRFKSQSYIRIFLDKRFIIQRILAAILMWRYEETCTPKSLYDNLKIYYEQMRRMMEIISYRLDIIRFSLYIAPGKNSSNKLRKELGFQCLIKLEEKLAKISDDIMYQPSSELCNLLAVQNYDMYKIQRLKSVESEYNRLTKLTVEEKMPEGYIQKLIRKMKSWPPNWREAFLKKFRGLFDDKNF